MDLSGWTPPPAPPRAAMEGRYVRLEPLSGDHAPDLFRASAAPGADERFRWLPETPPRALSDMQDWVDRVAQGSDPLFFAVIDRATGRACGRQSLMRIERVHGVIEIGHILWGPALQRSRMATEALFLSADLVFGLGYRRFEWKCNDANAPSKRAALRFGFRPEGVFRNHMIVKGASRDTAWFAMTDDDWHRLRPLYQAWLSPGNFDGAGQQRSPLRV